MKIALNVNGKPATIDADDPQMPLLYALRDDLGLHGPRFGCGLGQCGACTVHVDGKAVRSCVMPVGSDDRQEDRDARRPGHARASRIRCRQAFIDEQAVQCGYCINGMIMQAAALAANQQEADASTRSRRRSPRTCAAAARICASCARSSARPKPLPEETAMTITSDSAPAVEHRAARFPEDRRRARRHLFHSARNERGIAATAGKRDLDQDRRRSIRSTASSRSTPRATSRSIRARSISAPAFGPRWRRSPPRSCRCRSTA